MRNTECVCKGVTAIRAGSSWGRWLLWPIRFHLSRGDSHQRRVKRGGGDQSVEYLLQINRVSRGALRWWDMSHGGHCWGFSLTGYTVMLSSLCNSFEDRAPVDGIYGCPIFTWVAVTWLKTGAADKDCSPSNDHRGDMLYLHNNYLCKWRLKCMYMCVFAIQRAKQRKG